MIQGTYSSTYDYDSLDQLISRTSAGLTTAYQYDDAGNLVVKEGVPQAYGTGVCGDGRRGPHALAASGGDCYSYDDNGNVVSTSSSGLALTWNSENMATRVAKETLSYQKHFLGSSLWKKSDAGLTTYYLPSLRKEGAQTRKLYGAFAERSAEHGQLRFYHPDHLGSSTVMTAAGAVVAHRSAFKPYGEDVDAGGGGFVPKLRFNFKEKELGLYDYGARLYNPATGRWLSADSDLDGPNRYAYVGNNPLGFIDPSGHQKERKQEEIVVDPVPVVVNVRPEPDDNEKLKEGLDTALAVSEATGASVHAGGELFHEAAHSNKFWLERALNRFLGDTLKVTGGTLEGVTVLFELGVTTKEVIHHAKHGRKREAYKAAGEGLGAVAGGVGGGRLGGALGGPAAPLTASIGSITGSKSGRHYGGILGEVTYELVTDDWSRITPPPGRSRSVPPPGYLPNVPGSPVYNPAYKVCATCFLPLRPQ